MAINCWQLALTVMTNSQRLERVRQIINSWLSENGRSEAQTVCESILIRDGYYCGRKFHCGDRTAIWFCEADQIKIYDSQSNLLASFQVAARPETVTKVA